MNTSVLVRIIFLHTPLLCPTEEFTGFLAHFHQPDNKEQLRINACPFPAAPPPPDESFGSNPGSNPRYANMYPLNAHSTSRGCPGTQLNVAGAGSRTWGLFYCFFRDIKSCLLVKGWSGIKSAMLGRFDMEKYNIITDLTEVSHHRSFN